MSFECEEHSRIESVIGFLCSTGVAWSKDNHMNHTTKPFSAERKK